VESVVQLFLYIMLKVLKVANWIVIGICAAFNAYVGLPLFTGVEMIVFVMSIVAILDYVTGSEK